MSPHNSNNSKSHKADSKADSMQNSASSKMTALPTIMRTSNHSTAEYTNNNDADSACSWVELDFDHAGATAGRGKGKQTKPLSHVHVAQYLADDQESDKEDDDSSTTSILSEDFSVENGKNNKNATENNKGYSKGEDRNRNPSHRNEENDEDSMISVTSFASESFANGISFDDLLAESLIASNDNLTSKSPKQKDAVPPLLDGVIEGGNAGVQTKPASYRSAKSQSSVGDATKPGSELSKSSGSKRPQKKLSPKPKQSQKKASGHKSKSPGPSQGRKRLQSSTTNTSNREPGDATADNEAKENDKKHSSKPKQKSAPTSMRRRHPQPSSGDDHKPNEAAIDSEQKDAKKKNTPKTKRTSSVPSQRRQRPRSSDGDEVANGSAEEEGKEQKPGEGLIANSSNRSLGGTGDAKRKQERHRTKPKSSRSIGHNNGSNGKSHRRKTPTRSGSGDARRSKKGEAADRSEKREIRKRHKKKSHGSDNELEDDTEREIGTKSRSGHRERKEKMRRKSNSSETKEPKPDRPPTEKKMKKKKQIDAAKAIAREDELISKPVIDESDEGDAELTYSFHFQSDDGSRDADDWLKYHHSTSSLSYNSFAQFSLDVTEINRSGTFHVPDDASQKSFSSNHSIEASVVFMEGKSRSRHTSLHSAISFDGDNDSRCDNDTGTRSTRSCPTGTAEGAFIKPGKQLRRRLKKKESSNEKDGKQNRNDSNAEVKKKNRMKKPGGVERTNSLTQGDAVPGGGSGGGRRTVERTRSHNESAALRSSSASKRRDGHDKSTRRKKEKLLGLSHSKLKQVVKSKSAHIRSLSISPKKEVQKGKFLILDDQSDDREGLPSDKVILLNDMDDDANAHDSESWRSPMRSPRERQVHKTSSNPCPSPSIHITEVTTPSLRGKHSLDADCSPMSFPGSSPSHMDNQKKVLKPSSSRRALLSADTESDDDDDHQSGSDFVNESPGSAHGRISRGGVQRTPSSLLSAVRNLKQNSSKKMQNSSSKMLSKVKRTLSVSGRGTSTFKTSALEEIEIGMSTMKGYVSRKERQRKMMESESRRGQVKNSLYACMSDDDDSVDISTLGVSEDDNDSSAHKINIDNTDRDQGSISSFTPKRVQSLEKSKMNHPSENPGSERPSRPRRVHSLPVGVRR